MIYSKHWTVFKLDGTGGLTPVSDFHPNEVEALTWVKENGEVYGTYYVLQSLFVEAHTGG